MKITKFLPALVLAGGLAASAQAALLTFDDLPTLPAADSNQDLYFSNNSSSVYGGVTWDPGFAIVGDAYRVDTGTPGPLFGLPHSGHYFLTNRGYQGGSNDAMMLTTSQVLTGAWFGRNEYYGYGAGADQVTINALSGSTVLAAVVVDLAELNAGLPEPLQFVDTSSFLALAGITGYRIDRRELGSQSGNWVADDFTFVAPRSVPEPATAGLAAAALLLLGWQHRLGKARGRWRNG